MKKILWWANIIAGICLLLSYLSTQISPESIKILALFGLTYPLWLLINFLYIFIWVLSKKKRKRALLSVVLLLLGWNIHPTYYKFGSAEVITYEGESTKILSYNVRSFDRYLALDGSKTRDKIFEIIDDQEADIMCFQEFYYTTKTSDFNTRDSILEFSNAKYIHEKYTHHMTGGRHFGVVTMSSFPIIFKGEISFENDDNNFCIYTDIVTHTDTIRVFNAHFSSIRFNKEDYEFFDPDNPNEEKEIGSNLLRIGGMIMSASEKRVSQSQKVREKILNSPYPVILCGDFNDPPISYTYHQFNDILEDSFMERGHGLQNTYIGKFPSFRIDYIWHSENFECLSYKTIQEELSDHKAIVIQIKQRMKQ